MNWLKDRWLLLAALGGAASLIAACGGDDDEPSGPAATATGELAEISVEITSPEDGATLEPGDIEVALDISEFEIVDKLGEAPVAGEGHVHYYINVAEIPTAPGEPAVTDDETTYHAEATTSFTWLGVRPGTHTFGVQLVNNDHTPLEPPVTEEVTVTVD
jgi:hypothetical protein